MPPDRVSMRTRMSLLALNLVTRVAYGIPRPRFPHEGPPKNVARILVIELWNIGDAILTMPFLSRLRSSFPRARITLLAKPFAESLLDGTGLVDEFMPVDLTWTESDRVLLTTKMADLWRLGRKLRARKFDIAFSARLHVREHILLALSGATRRVGFRIGNGNSALTDVVAFNDPHGHKAEDWMRLVEPFGVTSSPIEVPRLRIAQPERLWAKEYLSSKGIVTSDLLIGIHPGASLVEKRWPLQRFQEVSAAIGRECGVRVLAFAEPSGYGSQLFEMPGVVGAQVGLRELMALIERCNLLVCNDSGPMHIAGALGVPTIAMFGAGIGQWFAPLGDGHRVLSPADGATPPTAIGERIEAPTAITTSQVLDAVRDAVREMRGSATFSGV